MKKLRWVLLGCGRIGQAHAGLIAAHPDMELVGIYDPSEEALEHFPYPAPRVRDLDQLGTLGAEVALIAAPNGRHAELAIAALRQGLHAVIEKPMTTSRASAEQVLQVALEQSRQVFVVMQNRHSPMAIWLRNVVQQGRLGTLRMADVRCYWNRDERYYGAERIPGRWHGSRDQDGGPLFTQFSHFIDTLYWLFGSLKLIGTPVFANFAHQANTEFEDSGLIHFELAEGALGSMAYTTAVPEANFESAISLIGSKGALRISGQYLEQLDFCSLSEIRPGEFAEVREAASREGVHVQNRAAVHRNVLEVLRSEAAVGTTALEGMKVVEFIEKVYRLRPG